MKEELKAKCCDDPYNPKIVHCANPCYPMKENTDMKDINTLREEFKQEFAQGYKYSLNFRYLKRIYWRYFFDRM